MNRQPPLFELPRSNGACSALGSLNHFGHNHEIALGAPTASSLWPAANDADLDIARLNSVLRFFVNEVAQFQLHWSEIQSGRNTESEGLEFDWGRECRHRFSNGGSRGNIRGGNLLRIVDRKNDVALLLLGRGPCQRGG